MFFELRPALEQMSDSDAGQLLKLILRYGETGVEDVEHLSDLSRLIWNMTKPRVDYSLSQYERKQDASLKANKTRFLKSKGINKKACSPDTWEAFLHCTEIDSAGHFQLPDRELIEDTLDAWQVPDDERNGVQLAPVRPEWD